LVMFVRPLRDLVDRRLWVVHVVPTPNPEAMPEVLTAYCGTRFAPGTVEVLSEPRGIPCVGCLAVAPVSRAQFSEEGPVRSTRPGGQNHVGDRYTRWGLDVAPKLTAEEKAVVHDAFAVEFDSLPPQYEPHGGWAESMAYMCRRIARHHRGEPVGEWVPAWERQNRHPEGRPRDVS
jgi:hypothetical protein